MSKYIAFSIPGEPRGKGRPRFTTRGHAFTPEKTRVYEENVRWAYQNKFHGFCIDEGIPVHIGIKAYFGIPQRTPKEKKVLMLAERIAPLKKPDIDNVAKIILDALNGVAFHDDKQVVSLMVNKYYAASPRVEVSIGAIEDETP